MGSTLLGNTSLQAEILYPPLFSGYYFYVKPFIGTKLRNVEIKARVDDLASPMDRAAQMASGRPAEILRDQAARLNIGARQLIDCVYIDLLEKQTVTQGSY